MKKIALISIWLATEPHIKNCPSVKERSQFLINVDFSSQFLRLFVLKSRAVIFDSGGALRSPTWQIKQGCLFGNGSTMDLYQILSVVNIRRCIREAKAKYKKARASQSFRIHVLHQTFYVCLSDFFLLVRRLAQCQKMLNAIMAMIIFSFRP